MFPKNAACNVSTARVWAVRILILIFALSIFRPGGVARADIGPKPSMTFAFVQEQGGTPPAIVRGTLLQCEQPDCVDGEPLMEAGPQRFTCTEIDCYSMAYGYREYGKLVIEFADGRSLESNVFGKRYFEARYRVTVRADDLLVEEQGGGLRAPEDPGALVGMAAALLGACCLGVLFLAVVGALVWKRRSRQGKTASQGQRSLMAAAAANRPVALVLVLVLGGLAVAVLISLTLQERPASLALLVTLFIEAGLAGVYASWRKQPRLALLVAVALANLITLPALWWGLSAWDRGVSPLPTLFGEALVWVLEAVILSLAVQAPQRFRTALALSLGLNLVSLLLGLGFSL